MSFDEGVDKVKTRTPKEAVNRRIEKGSETKERIFRIIEASEDGKSSADLKKETGLSRDRIHAICKDFMDKGMLYKTGRFGKYRLTPKALGDPAKKGFFFGSKIMKSFSLSKYLSANNMFCNAPYIEGILNSNENISKLSLNRDPNIKDKLCLFEFALNIGSIITLEMIMGIKFAADSSEMNMKDKVAWEWIDSVINPGLILVRFADIPEIERRLKRNSSNERPYSFYDMDSKEVASLMQSFQDVFPEVYRKSEEILASLQRRIDSERQFARDIHERYRRMEIEDPKHTKCSGQLIPEIKTTLDGLKVQQCAKCHRWIKVRKSK